MKNDNRCSRVSQCVCETTTRSRQSRTFKCHNKGFKQNNSSSTFPSSATQPRCLCRVAVSIIHEHSSNLWHSELRRPAVVLTGFHVLHTDRLESPPALLHLPPTTLILPCLSVCLSPNRTTLLNAKLTTFLCVCFPTDAPSSYNTFSHPLQK